VAGGASDQVFCYGRQPGDAPVVWEQAPTTVPASLRGSEWTRINTTRKVVALTFDAGANDAGVASILGTLRANGVAATFFLTGRWAETFPQQAATISTSFPIGNHSFSHPDFRNLSDAQIRDELARAEAAIRSATAQDPRPMFRFPFGGSDARTIGVVNQASYGGIRWTVDTLGWQGTSGGMTAQKVVDRVLATLQPGQIVLMHLGSHPQDGSTLDADALPAIISALRQRGYGFVTIRRYV
jgi:peptidoglycan/xylan/chitin deacetylase (PgdA/CDA1 family)